MKNDSNSPSRKPLKPRRLAFFLAVLTLPLLAVCVPAGAQEVFELKDQGFEKVKEPQPGTPEGKLQEVRKAIAEGHGKQAAKMAKLWIKEYPNHPMLPDAYLLKGDARVSYGYFYKALFDYEYVVRAYPDSRHFHTALERELAVADAFGRGVKRHFVGMQILPAQSEAEEIYIRIQERAPGSKIAERAGIELADFYYRRSEMFLAAQAYDLFLQNYPNSQWREHAMKQQILANLATFKGPRFDATGLVEAQRRLQDYREDFPAAAEQIGAQGLLTRVDESLASRSFLVAQWYEERERKVAAVAMYRRVMKEHPGTVASHRALERLELLESELFPGGVPRELDATPSVLPPPGAVPDRVGEEKPGEPSQRAREPEPPAAAPSSDAPPVPKRPGK